MSTFGFMATPEAQAAILAGKDIKTGEEAQDIMPTGGGAMGFTGLWKTSVLYRSWFSGASASDISTDDAPTASVREFTSGCWLEWNDKGHSIQEAEALGLDRPQPAWTLTLEKKDAVGTLPDWFDAEMKYEVPMTGLRAGQRHQFHMFALPSLVQAIALKAEVLTTPVFNYESTMMNPDAMGGSHEWEAIGEGQDFRGSKMWKAREDLWAALGEDSPDHYSAASGKYQATSETLLMALGAVYNPLELWMTIAAAPDPHSKAAYTNAEGEEKRRRVPVVLAVFANEAEAEEAVGAEPAAETSSGVKIPKAWAGDIEAWKKYVGDEWNKLAGPKPKRRKQMAANDSYYQEEFEATAEEFLAWVDEMEL